MIRTIYIPREICEEITLDVDNLVEDVVNNYKEDAVDYSVLEYFNDNIGYFIDRTGLIDFDWDLPKPLQIELSNMFICRLTELYPELASDE